MHRIRALIFASILVAFPFVAHATTVSSNPDGTSTVSDNGYTFTNFQLGQLPAEYCPDPNSPCQNRTSEPQIRADKFGNFFGASENGLAGGTEAWKSIDSGRHYVHLPSPNELSTNFTGTPKNVSPAGGDVDLATASQKNSLGIYNVYVASLELSSIAVSTSMNGGHTWATNNKASSVPGNDREWIAADAANKVCISYRDLAAATLPVECSYTAGQPAGVAFQQVQNSIDAAHAYIATNFQIGNLAIDQDHTNSSCTPVVPTETPPATAVDPTTCDYVYQTFSGIDQADLVPACATASSDCNTHVVYMAVSNDGGRTFTDHVVYDNPNHLVSYGHQFTNVSVDRAGNVYSFFTDDQNVYYKYSTDHGVTWQPSGAPIRVSGPPATTAIMPWSVAGDPGKVDVVYYGTSYPAGGNGCSTSTVTCQHPDNYPTPTSCTSGPSTTGACWYVYFAQSLNALSTAPNFKQAQASPVNHMGGVCEGGIGCTGNRDLYDDFGVAASPRTGLASIIYSDDQSNQINQNVGGSTCTAGANNTSTCDHTSIATQLSGCVIYGSEPSGCAGSTSGGGTGTGSGGGGTDCAPTADSSKAESDAVANVNSQRAAAGMAPLAVNSKMSDEARNHSCDAATHGDPSQRGSDGSLPTNRIAAAGIPFTASAENIGLAASPLASTALAALDSNLLSDPASKANILNPAFKSVGVGAVYVEGVLWLTEDFTD